ncbi:hypothetical protein LJR030_004652 [Rhizobium sp. LjRoot30]|uniref:NADase-type glycan-binding domain-containing protein n=1 Tax=Rhizobium sp. LjRoot30 TaxID=3342320 RepID=UPI003ED092A8
MLGNFSMTGRMAAGAVVCLLVGMAFSAMAADDPNAQPVPNSTRELRLPDATSEPDMPEEAEPDMPDEAEPVFAVRPARSGESCQRQIFTVGSATVCVSSILEPQLGSRYGSVNLTDGRGSTAWVEGAAGDGIGEYIAIEFDAPVSISGMEVANGYGKNADLFEKNSRVRNFSLSTSRGDRQSIALRDERDWQTIGMSLPEKTKWLVLTISSVYPGWKYQDTAISGLDLR